MFKYLWIATGKETNRYKDHGQIGSQQLSHLTFMTHTDTLPEKGHSSYQKIPPNITATAPWYDYHYYYHDYYYHDYYYYHHQYFYHYYHHGSNTVSKDGCYI